MQCRIIVFRESAKRENQYTILTFFLQRELAMVGIITYHYKYGLEIIISVFKEGVSIYKVFV